MAVTAKHSAGRTKPLSRFYEQTSGNVSQMNKPKPIKMRKTRLGSLSEEERRRRIGNTRETSAMRVANKIRRNESPERVRQFEEAFMKPRMGGGKRTKQQR